MLDFGDSELTANNLGGQGPVLTDPPYLEYSMLQDLLPDEVCLRVTNTSAYMPSFNPGGGVEFNGLSGQFGIINVLSDTSVDLKFEFVNKTDETPYVVPFFIFTWFDFDMNPNGGRVESLVAENVFSTFFVTLDTTLEITTDMGAMTTTFMSTVPGFVSDNPMDPSDLTPEQEAKAVAFVYEDISSFCITLCISGPSNEFGRNLIFGGVSDLVESPPPPSPPPTGDMPVIGSSPPPPGVVVKSDPHFQGLDGEYFDFDGEPGRVYALMVHSEDEMALIARFETAYTTGVSYKNNVLLPYKAKGTWVSSVGLSVSSTSEGNMESATLLVSSSGSALSDADYKLESGSMQLIASSESALDMMKVAVSKKGPSTVVSFTTDVLDGKVFIVPPPSSWDVDAADEEKMTLLTHLNIAIERLSISDIEHLDGVIGVSARGLKPSEARADESAFEAVNFVDEELVALLP